MANKDFRATAISGSITRLVDGKSYIRNGSGITITSASLGGQIEISATGGGGGGSEWTRAGGDLHSTTNVTTTDVLVGNTAEATAHIILKSDGAAVFNEQGNQSDFRIQTVGKEFAFFTDAVNNRVLILSGGSGASNDEARSSDVSFYVSGTNAGDGTSATKRARGVTLFGGDTVISGGLYLGSRLYNEGDHDTYIRPRSDRWEFHAGGKRALDIDYAGSQKAVTFNTTMDDVDFQVFTDTTSKLGIKIDGAQEKVLFLSGSGAKTSPDENSYVDLAFFVSGSVRSRGTTTRGVAVFGGDTVISGSLVVGNNAGDGGTISGSIHHTEDGLSYLVAGTNVTITSGTNGQVTINSSGGGGGGGSEWSRAGTPDRVYPNTTATTDVLVGGTTIANADIILHSEGGAVFNEQRQTADANDFVVKGAVGKTMIDCVMVGGINHEQVLILSGGAGSSPNPKTMTGVHFHVSGAIGGRNPNALDTGLSVFGGDALVSGSLIVENTGRDGGTISGSIHHTEDGLSYIVGGSNVTVFSGTNGQITINATGGGGGATPDSPATSVQFNDAGAFGGSSNLTFDKTTNTLSTVNMTGSLTRLSDGKSYLVAGTNVTITSASLGGQVEISSTGGGDTYSVNVTNAGGGNLNFNLDAAVGSDSFVQFQNGSNITLTRVGPNALSIAAETYDLNATQDGGNVDLNLTSGTGGDNSQVQLTAGTNITLTESGTNEITIAATDENETYDLNAAQDGSNVDLNLTSTSGGDNSQVQLTAGTNITLTETGTNQITIANTVSPDTYSVNVSDAGGGNLDLNLDAASGTDTSVELRAGSNITLTRNTANALTIAATGGGSVGGSGANNQIAVWSGASTLDSSQYLFYDADASQSKLGVGTDTPQADIHVFPRSSPTAAVIRLGDRIPIFTDLSSTPTTSNTATTQIQLACNSSGKDVRGAMSAGATAAPGVAFGSFTEHDTTIYTSNRAAMTITGSTRAIGIGTRKPDRQLHLYSGSGGHAVMRIGEQGTTLGGVVTTSVSEHSSIELFANKNFNNVKGILLVSDSAISEPAVSVGSVRNHNTHLIASSMAALTVSGSNRAVGVGTPRPSRQLHVYSGSGDLAMIRIGELGVFDGSADTSVTEYARLEMKANKNGGNVSSFIDSRDSGASASRMQIGTNSPHDVGFLAANYTAMTISGSNRAIGIGILNPDRQLHVYSGSGGSSKIKVGEKGTFGGSATSSATNFARIEFMANGNSNNVQGFLDARDDGVKAGQQLGTKTNHDLKFYTNDQERVAIKARGDLANYSGRQVCVNFLNIASPLVLTKDHHYVMIQGTPTPVSYVRLPSAASAGVGKIYVIKHCLPKLGGSTVNMIIVVDGASEIDPVSSTDRFFHNGEGSSGLYWSLRLARGGTLSVVSNGSNRWYVTQYEYDGGLSL